MFTRYLDSRTTIPEPPKPQSRRVRRAIGIALGFLCLIGIPFAQIHAIRNLLSHLLSYAPVVFPSVIALGTIVFKDWKNLPHQFRKSAGGGWSFLNACNQEDGEQWTGLHQRMDQLFAMAIGLGLAKWCLPRAMWDVFPGGMPYVVVEI